MIAAIVTTNTVLICVGVEAAHSNASKSSHEQA